MPKNTEYSQIRASAKDLTSLRIIFQGDAGGRAAILRISPYLALFFLSTMISSCSHSTVSPPGPFVVCDAGSGYSSLANNKRFGIFAESFYGNYDVALDSMTQLLGVKPQYTLWYQQIDDVFPATAVHTNATRGINTVIGINISSFAVDSIRNDTLLEEVAHGKWDAALSQFAAEATQSGAPVYLRFGYEMNGTWFPWGGKPGMFVAAWLHARHVFWLQGASNVSWVFCPGALSPGQTIASDITPYYPGDTAVDIVGVDGYNYGDAYDKYHSWESFDDIFRLTLPGLHAIGKPLWICETACPSDPRRPAWIAGMLDFLDNNPCVETVLWFNDHKSMEPDFRLESDTASLDEMRTWLSH